MALPYEQQLTSKQLQARRAPYLPLVQREAARVGMPWQLLDALIIRESGYVPNAYGDSRQAIGLGQLHPAAAIDGGIRPDQRLDPEANVRATANYLSQMLKRAGGDVGLAALGYNAGPAAIRPGTTAQGTDGYRPWFADVGRLVGRSSATAVPTAVPASNTANAMLANVIVPDAVPIKPLAPVDMTIPTIGGSLPAGPATDPNPAMSLNEILRYAGYQPSYSGLSTR